MYIVMNSDKSLTKTEDITIYQNENLVDRIQFLFPQKYKDLLLSEFTVKLEYTDQANIPHSEKLVRSSELYRDRMKYEFPVTTSITQFSGSISIHVVFEKVNQLLHTGSVVLDIIPTDRCRYKDLGNEDDVIEFDGTISDASEPSDVVEFNEQKNNISETDVVTF